MLLTKPILKETDRIRCYLKDIAIKMHTRWTIEIHRNSSKREFEMEKRMG